MSSETNLESTNIRTISWHQNKYSYFKFDGLHVKLLEAYFDNVCHSDSKARVDSLLFDLKTLKAATKNFSVNINLDKVVLVQSVSYCYR